MEKLKSRVSDIGLTAQQRWFFTYSVARQVNFILYTNSEKLGLLWLKRDSSKFILALFHAVVKTIPLTDYNPSGWMVSQAAVSLFQ